MYFFGKHRLSSIFFRVSNSLILDSIRQGLTLMIPVMIVGAFSIFLNHLPIPAYQTFMTQVFGEGWREFGIFVHQGTFAVMSLGMLLAISYSIARNSTLAQAHNVNPMIAAIVSAASLFAVLRIENGFLPVSTLGSLGVFIAIIVSCVSSMIFILLSSFPPLKVRLFSNAADQNLIHALSSLFPAMITVIIFALIHVLLLSMGITDIHEAMNLWLKNIFRGSSSSLFTAVLFVLLIHLFWFFGIHGNNVLEPVTQNLFVPALAVNQDLIAKGLQPSEIFTKQFFDVFVFLGGSGATLSLIVALIIWTRRNNTKQIAVISTLPGVFNVNEIMVFGVPIILNFYLFLPFVFLPALLTGISYTAIKLGLVNPTIAPVDWTTPLIVGGYTATGSIGGALLQLFNLVAGVFFYLPFIRYYEKHLEKGNERNLNRLLDEVFDLPEIKRSILINRTDDIGNLARLLLSDMKRDLYNGNISLVYQPQVDSNNRMTGMEALLRWRHPVLGSIAPPITIAIAEESPIIHELGIWIIRTACRQMERWQTQGMADVTLSINLSPYQLDNESLPGQVGEILRESHLAPSMIEIEITEQTALGGIARLGRLNKLRSMGLKLAMDDFGMGHSSLMYLKELNLDTIKLDGALVKEVLTNQRCSEIISSIVQLGRTMEINIIAEFVDIPEQQKRLQSLGCLRYQGYLYSPPLKTEELGAFYFRHLHEASLTR